MRAEREDRVTMLSGRPRQAPGTYGIAGAPSNVGVRRAQLTGRPGKNRRTLMHCRRFGRGCGLLQKGGTCVCTCSRCVK